MTNLEALQKIKRMIDDTEELSHERDDLDSWVKQALNNDGLLTTIAEMCDMQLKQADIHVKP